MNSCPYCNSTNIIKKGKTKSGKQRYKCKDCNKYFVEKNIYVKSLAGTNKKYIKAKLKVKNKKLIIIIDNNEFVYDGRIIDYNQYQHPILFRSELIEYLENIQYGKKYINIQLRNYPNNLVHIQIKHSKPFNRDYGAAFDIEFVELGKYIRKKYNV